MKFEDSSSVRPCCKMNNRLLLSKRRNAVNGNSVATTR